MKYIRFLKLQSIATQNLSTIILLTITFMLSTGCSVFGVESVAEAPYQMVLNEEEFELRDYATFVVAETRVEARYKEAGNAAFKKLFSYISGDNEGSGKIEMTSPVISEATDNAASQKIAMTAPVLSQQDGEAWVYRFVLPKGYTMENSPRPLNPDVQLAEVEAKRVATIRYSGRTTDKARIKNTEALISWIESKGLEQLSTPRWAGYNAPWTLPAMRRNEVLIDVSMP